MKLGTEDRTYKSYFTEFTFSRGKGGRLIDQNKNETVLRTEKLYFMEFTLSDGRGRASGGRGGGVGGS